MTTEATASIARRYFDAWTSGKGADVLRPLLLPEFVFEAGKHRVEGREAFLSGGRWPSGATTKMLSDGYDGEDAFQLYEAAHSAAQVKIVEHLIVRDGLIVSSEIVVDGADFLAFMAGDSAEPRP